MDRQWIQLFSVIVWLVLVGTTAAGERPEYQVSKTSVPIQVDGRLDDPSWQAVSAVGSFVNSHDGSPSSLQTEARVLYDDSYIYFAFECEDDNLWATYTQRDEHLWLEEVVEVFVHADPTRPSYIELEVNPLGTMLDIYLLDIRKPLLYESWNSARLKWAVQTRGTVDGEAGDSGWSCEIALPLEDVVTAPSIPPKQGERWRLNLYRVEKKPARAGLAWAPTYLRDFHLPNMFGEIVFSDRVVP
jgi:hypothetical protein